MAFHPAFILSDQTSFPLKGKTIFSYLLSSKPCRRQLCLILLLIDLNMGICKRILKCLFIFVRILIKTKRGMGYYFGE